MGRAYLCHATLVDLLPLSGSPLYVKDVMNPEKQDDGAARRLFIPNVLETVVGDDGELISPSFEGFFILSFIFGMILPMSLRLDSAHITLSLTQVMCLMQFSTTPWNTPPVS